MNSLDQLPEISSEILSGLKADETLKHRILLSAAESGRSTRVPRRTLVPLCALSALVIALCVLIPQLSGPGSSSGTSIQVIAAGSRRTSSPIHLHSMITTAANLDQEEKAACDDSPSGVEELSPENDDFSVASPEDDSLPETESPAE